MDYLFNNNFTINLIYKTVIGLLLAIQIILEYEFKINNKESEN